MSTMKATTISGKGGKKIPGVGPKSGIKNGKISHKMRLKLKIKDLLRTGSFGKLTKKF